MEKNMYFIVLFIIVASLIGGHYIGNYEEEEEYLDNSLLIPVRAHLIIDPRGVYTSSRNELNLITLFDEVNRIWSEAGIYFSLEEVVVSNVSYEAIPNAINGNYLELFNHQNLKSEGINLFLVQSLNGINGLAIININSVLLSDFTSVNDYRTASHEFGHILGLRHVDDREKLMARGRNGEMLDDWEIKIARERAKDFIVWD